MANDQDFCHYHFLLLVIHIDHVKYIRYTIFSSAIGSRPWNPSSPTTAVPLQRRQQDGDTCVAVAVSQKEGDCDIHTISARRQCRVGSLGTYLTIRRPIRPRTTAVCSLTGKAELEDDDDDALLQVEVAAVEEEQRVAVAA